jgi:ferric-dicitrate binding protein FerR (iron transport regulator)
MEIDFQVIKRYLEGREKKGDKDQIIDWFSDIRFEKDIRKKYRLYWDEMGDNTNIEECDGAAILGRVYHKMKYDDYKKLPGRKSVVRILNVMSKVAAILFIPLLAYLWVIKGSDTSSLARDAYSEIYSPLGTRTIFYLPDGSSGWLNGGSYLKFPTEFRGKSRKVILRGEAYFDVLTNPRKPFIVKGEHTDVIAYGTSFNVQNYPEDPEIRITLVSGNIGILKRNDGRVVNLANLKPDQMYVYYPGTGLNRVETVKVNKVTAWKEGKLAFRDESFTEVVRKINRWYNVEVKIMDETLKTYSYQATFIDETLDEVLKLLQRTAPIEFKDLGRAKGPDGTYGKRKLELYYKSS